MNICTNAAHAMGEKGGTLFVELSEVAVQPGSQARDLNVASGPYVKLSISDTGCGIEPAHITRLFDPFFTTKKVGEGTGLGLAVVYGIVHDHGGSIKVASRPGQGAIFDVYLPILEHEEIKPARPETELIRGGYEKILFVDDESDLVELGSKVLSGLGYQVTPCTDSLKALKIYSAAPASFDLVITDMNMPSMSGQ